MFVTDLLRLTKKKGQLEMRCHLYYKIQLNVVHNENSTKGKQG